MTMQVVSITLEEEELMLSTICLILAEVKKREVHL
jgi:hypothetical protein